MIHDLKTRKLSPELIVRIVVGVILSIYLGWRIYLSIFGDQAYGPDTWLRFLITGLVIGGIYALIAIGYTLVYGILFMINFAHGAQYMLGAYVAWMLLSYLGIGFWGALVIAPLVVAVLVLLIADAAAAVALVSAL